MQIRKKNRMKLKRSTPTFPLLGLMFVRVVQKVLALLKLEKGLLSSVLELTKIRWKQGIRIQLVLLMLVDPRNLLLLRI